MNKPLSILSKVFAIIGLCGSMLAIGTLAVRAYPAYASNAQVEDKSKSTVEQHASHRLTLKDWMMIAINM